MTDAAHPFLDFTRTARLVQRHPLEPGGLEDQVAQPPPSGVQAAPEPLPTPAEPAKPRFLLRSGRDISQPLPKIRWLVRGLAIGPGRPTILGGYGGVGKTFAAQELALIVASGRGLLWNCYAVQGKGRVLHIDHEQGQWITDWRYQRLAWSLGLDIGELGDRLEVVHYPDLYLTNPDAEAVLLELCAGRELVLIDSLRAICPGVDENDSKMGAYLYLLARVSERTGCVFVVVHHEGKSNPESPRSGIERLRGSSAIAAGAGSVLSFVKDNSAPGLVRIEHTRANLGQEAPAELVRLLDEGDVDENTEKTVGIRFEHVPREQVVSEANTLSDEEHERAFHDLCERMLACVRRNQGKPEGVTGAGQLARLLRIGERPAREAFAHLREVGSIISNGRTGRASRWQVAQDEATSSEPHDAYEGDL